MPSPAPILSAQAVVIPFPGPRQRFGGGSRPRSRRLGAALLPESTWLQGALTALGMGLPVWLCLGAALVLRA